MKRYIGDIHGNLKSYKQLIDTPLSTVQVGDFGKGFIKPSEDVSWIQPKDKFIRGNHDNLAECKTCSHWLPDGTYLDDTFYIGGAYSIDAGRRIPGINWWSDEELSSQSLSELTDLYQELKPNIVVSHDAPEGISKIMGLGIPNLGYITTRTGSALKSMFELHQPKYWIFGHWHPQYNSFKTVDRTTFICLAIDSYIDL